MKTSARPPRSALVLTAGLGTRFRPLSLVRAKPSVSVAGESLVRRILRRLHAAGVRDVVLNLHHRPETIAAEAGDGHDLGLSVRYSWEPELLGSAGGPRRALDLIGEDPFLIVNGDTLTDVSLDALAEAHERSGATVTLALSPALVRSRYGGVAIEPVGTGVPRVTGFVPRLSRGGAPSTGTPHLAHFVGVQIACRAAFRDLPPLVRRETFTDAYPPLMSADANSVRGMLSSCEFWDVGTPADYLTTALELARRETGRAVSIGRRVRVDPTSHVAETALWDDVTIDARCSLTRCIVTDRVHLPAGIVLSNAVVVAGPGATDPPIVTPLPDVPAIPHAAT